jgi:hypothetical protein
MKKQIVFVPHLLTLLLNFSAQFSPHKAKPWPFLSPLVGQSRRAGLW